MTTLLAIDTATDQCSVALHADGVLFQRAEIAPRRHSQLVFPMLDAVMAEAAIGPGQLDAVTYGSGPGSFTGLRIAASVAQGICFARGIPGVPVSTLACQVQAAFRGGHLPEGQDVLSLIDARIGELFWAVLSVEHGLAQWRTSPSVCRPPDIPLQALGGVSLAIGDGLQLQEQLPASLREQLTQCYPGVRPGAVDLLPQALHDFAAGKLQRPEQIAPVYVRDEIAWKKLAEQGKPQ